MIFLLFWAGLVWFELVSGPCLSSHFIGQWYTQCNKNNSVIQLERMSVLTHLSKQTTL